MANELSQNLFNQYNSNSKCILFSEVGVTQPIVEEAFTKKNSKKINLLWAGNLIPLKNFGLLLESLKLMPINLDWELKVAGDGRLFNYWNNKANELKFNQKIEFLGNVPFQGMHNLYNKADLFVFPSLREATGSVILEAMSYSIPVIALELNGAKNIIDKNCGILIPVQNKNQMVNDFKDAIIKLSNEPELRLKMGKNAKERIVKHFLWEKRGEEMQKYYNSVCGNG